MLSSPPWTLVLPAIQLVLLHQYQCHRDGCHTIFYICPGCYRGQRYCSEECRIHVRRSQHRDASATYQQTEAGRENHRRCQHAWQGALLKPLLIRDKSCFDRCPWSRERLRARAATSPVTDTASFNDFHSRARYNRAVGKPVPHLPDSTRNPPSYPFEWSGPRCCVCKRAGFVERRI